LRYIHNEGALGIKGEVKKIYDFEKDYEMAICTNGKETFIEILKGGHGWKVIDIISSEDEVIFKTTSNIVFKRFYIEKPKIFSERGKERILMNRGSVRGWHEAMSDTTKKGAIGKVWIAHAHDELAPGSKVTWISFGKGYKDKADVEFELGKKIAPVEIENIIWKECRRTYKNI